MFGIITLTLAAASSVTALVLPRVPDHGPPQGWATEYLEAYPDYHHRYLAIGCQNQHNTQFFSDCCHPLLATETLADARPAKCIPTAEQLAAVTSEPSSDDDGETDDSDDSGDSTPPPAPVSFSSTDDSQDPPSNDNSGSSHGKSSGHSSGGSPPSTDSTDSTDAPPPSDNNSGGGTSSGNTDTNTNNSGGGSGGNGEVITGGFATFYAQGSQAGACGDFHGDNELVAAMDKDRYGNVDAVSPLCGQRVHITNTDNGKSVEVLIVDACPTCNNENCIDLSPAAFDMIADQVTGVVPIAWSFI